MCNTGLHSDNGVNNQGFIIKYRKFLIQQFLYKSSIVNEHNDPPWLGMPQYLDVVVVAVVALPLALHCRTSDTCT